MKSFAITFQTELCRFYNQGSECVSELKYLPKGIKTKKTEHPDHVVFKPHTIGFD